MKIRTIYYDVTFIFTIEIIFLFLYLFSPTPTQFPLDLTGGLSRYFSENLSQFFIIKFIPYLPELLFHIHSVNIAIFLGLSIIWIPSLFLLTWLIRQLFVRVLKYQGFRFYYAYIPILFTLFMPFTLFDVFRDNGSWEYSVLSQIFIMFVSILSGIIFYLNGEKKFFAIALVAILLVNTQTFSMSFFLVSLLLLIFAIFTLEKRKYMLRSLFLIIVAVVASLVYLYASVSMVSFPYYNLAIPSVGPTDPNYRVFLLSIFNPSRGLWNVLMMQNEVNEPFFPLYYPTLLYSGVLLIITLISLSPFFYFSNKFRRLGAPIYLSLIALELMNSFANPFVSLVFPQNIPIFNFFSYIFNNNTVFYYPLQIMASLSFLISTLSFWDFLRFIRKHASRFITMERRIIRQKIGRYWRPVLATCFAIVMVSPVLSYDANHGEGNPASPLEYEPFITYFNTQTNASVYFDASSGNQVFSIVKSDLYPIENLKLTPDQTYPLSNAMSFFKEVNKNFQPEFMDYVLHMFGYNFFVTCNSTLSLELSSSGLFSLALNQSDIQVLRMSKYVESEKLVLLSSSASTLLNIINSYGIFPEWIYSPYLLNLNTLESIFNSGVSVYTPSYTTSQDLFPCINGSEYLIPARYTSNTYFSNRWEIGYLTSPAQETWVQNIRMLDNYSYQSELNVNYGYIFTSTQNASLNIHYALPEGDYVVLVNYLESNMGGTFSIDLSGNTNYINTQNSSSFFVTSYLEDLTSNGVVGVNIKNVKGFNTIAYLSFVPYSNYQQYLPIFNNYIDSSTARSIYSYLGVIHIYNLNISAPYIGRTLTYQQLFYLDLSLPGINSNLSNIVFTYSNGDPVYAFIQSISNNVNRTATIWLRMNGECSRTLHLIVLKRNVSFLGNYLGEAPDLSPSYGKYFNAPLIFGNASSPNAWDWVNSYEGWRSTNASATYVQNGIRVDGTLDGMPTINGGIYLKSNMVPGNSFTVYGWTQNNTVIELGGYGFIGGGGYYELRNANTPSWTFNTDVLQQRNRFYTFTLQVLDNKTLQAGINGTWFRNPSELFPIISPDYIYLREAKNAPQYFEFAFIRTMPIGGQMPTIMVS